MVMELNTSEDKEIEEKTGKHWAQIVSEFFFLFYFILSFFEGKCAWLLW